MFDNRVHASYPPRQGLDKCCDVYRFWCTGFPSPPDDMHPLPIRSLLLLLSFSSLVVAIGITDCLEDFKSDPNAIGGVDSRGYPTSAGEAVGFTYQTCVKHCGPQVGVFNWTEFTQLFASWLLPWLALISGLPFHSGSYMDDFISGELCFP